MRKNKDWIYMVIFMLSSFLFIGGSFLYASSLNLDMQKDYYLYKKRETLRKLIYAEEKARDLSNILEAFLKNKKLKRRLFFDEMDKEIVPTVELLKKIYYFLHGYPRYTDTEFDYNGKVAGLIKIFRDYEKAKYSLDLPADLMPEIRKEFFGTMYHEKAKQTLKLIKEGKSPKEVLKNIILLLDSLVATLEDTINIPLIKSYNDKIKETLLRNYRIYAYTSLLKSLEIADGLLKKNYTRAYGALP